LSRGELPCIGATTTDEYRRVIESDPTLGRRFTAVEIDEPRREEAFLILSNLAPRLSAHHRVAYDDEAVAVAIAWSARYLAGRRSRATATAVQDWARARAERRGRERGDPEAVAEILARQARMPIERLLEADADGMLTLDQILCER